MERCLVVALLVGAAHGFAPHRSSLPMRPAPIARSRVAPVSMVVNVGM
jgi:hypothetical protein